MLHHFVHFFTSDYVKVKVKGVDHTVLHANIPYFPLPRSLHQRAPLMCVLIAAIWLLLLYAPSTKYCWYPTHWTAFTDSWLYFGFLMFISFSFWLLWLHVQWWCVLPVWSTMRSSKLFCQVLPLKVQAPVGFLCLTWVGVVGLLC